MIGRDALMAAASGGEVRFDEPLSRHTTLGVGGPVDALVFPESVAVVADVVRLAAARGWPWWPLGGGSNLLVRDGGVRGVLISTARLSGLDRDGTTVVCQAGTRTTALLTAATKWHLGGLEFLAGIPGTVGGGLVMNAGTVLGDFATVTAEVTTVGPDGDLRIYDREACGFAYRSSSLGGDEIVVSAQLILVPRRRDEIEEQVRFLRQQRRQREPRNVRSAGSIFRNPVDDHAGRLIEACGLKGERSGLAQVSPVHANWIITHSGATAADVCALIERCREAVTARFGVTLELEVRVVGEEP